MSPDQPDAQVVDALVRSCWRLAFALANRFTRKYPTLRDDLESDAMLALYRAATHFDPSRGFKFSGYAHFCIDRSLHRLVKYELLRHPDRFRVVSPTDEDGDSLDPFALHADTSQVGIEMELAELMGTLPPKMSRRIRRHFLRGESPAQIARSEGVTSAAVRQHIAIGLRLMRETVEGK